MKLPVFKVTCIVVSLVAIAIFLVLLTHKDKGWDTCFCSKQFPITLTKEDIARGEAYTKSHNKNKGDR